MLQMKIIYIFLNSVYNARVNLHNIVELRVISILLASSFSWYSNYIRFS
jgi:hypothetical protein